MNVEDAFDPNAALLHRRVWADSIEKLKFQSGGN